MSVCCFRQQLPRIVANRKEYIRHRRWNRSLSVPVFLRECVFCRITGLACPEQKKYGESGSVVPGTHIGDLFCGEFIKTCTDRYELQFGNELVDFGRHVVDPGFEFFSVFGDIFDR